MATFYNQASLSYNGLVTNSNITEGEIINSITVTKTPLNASYSIGSSIAYAISIQNADVGDLCSLSITDDLGAYTVGENTVYPLSYVENSVRYYLNGVESDAPTVTSTAPLTISDIDVPGESNILIIYEASTNEFTPPAAQSSITNTVTATGCCITDPITAEATVTISTSTALTIAKSVCPDTVVGCGELTYTFVLQNTGNAAADAASNVVIRDVFNPKFESVSVTVDGQIAPTTAYSYDSVTGLFQTTEGALIVPAATFTQNPDGTITTTPGVTVVKVTGEV